MKFWKIPLALFALGMMFGATVEAAPKKTELPVVDERCDKFAQFAKSIAVLKEIGFTTDGTKQFVVEPKVSPYPVNLVRSKVYGSCGTPEDVYGEFYVKCTFTGYDNLMKLFIQEEALVQENAALKLRIEAHNDGKVISTKCTCPGNLFITKPI